MKIDPTGRVPGVPPEPVVPRVSKEATPPPKDQVDLKGSATASATYSRIPVERGEVALSREDRMAQEARAQKLADVRSRLESGAYNSRDMIERVVDRLLDNWKLGTSRKPDASSPS